MKNNMRSRISSFLTSEDGHVGVKPPLVLGTASASLLLAQAVVSPSAQAGWNCDPWSDDCSEGEYCAFWCDEWDAGTCVGTWHSRCESLDS